MKKEAAAGRVILSDEGLSLARGKDFLQSDEAGKPVVGWFDKTEDIAPAIKSKREFFGKKIGQVGNIAEELIPSGAVSANSLRRSLEEQLYKLPSNPETQAMSQKLRNHLESIIDNRKSIPFQEAQSQKNYYQWSPSKNLSMPADKDFQSALHTTFSRGMDQGVNRAARNAEAIGNTEALNELEKYGRYKGKYSSYAGADEQALQRSIQNLSNRAASPTDYMTGLTAGGGLLANTGEALPALALGLAAGTANKIARERGSAFVARSANAMVNALDSAPAILGKYAPVLLEAQKRGANQLMLTHQLLLQTKPDYLDTITKISEQEGEAQQ